MLSPADMLLIGAAALIFFGPDQLPKVAKRAGQVVREVQNTSQSFIREMERAADDTERRERYAADAKAAADAAPEDESLHETVVEDDGSAHGGAPHAGAAEPIGMLEAEPHQAPSEPKGGHADAGYEI